MPAIFRRSEMQSPKGMSAASAVLGGDYFHDELHVVEIDRVQDAGHLDMRVAFPLDLDG